MSVKYEGIENEYIHGYGLEDYEVDKFEELIKALKIAEDEEEMASIRYEMAKILGKDIAEEEPKAKTKSIEEITDEYKKINQELSQGNRDPKLREEYLALKQEAENLGYSNTMTEKQEEVTENEIESEETMAGNISDEQIEERIDEARADMEKASEYSVQEAARLTQEEIDMLLGNEPMKETVEEVKDDMEKASKYSAQEAARLTQEEIDMLLGNEPMKETVEEARADMEKASEYSAQEAARLTPEEINMLLENEPLEETIESEKIKPKVEVRMDRSLYEEHKKAKENEKASEHKEGIISKFSAWIKPKAKKKREPIEMQADVEVFEYKGYEFTDMLSISILKKYSAGRALKGDPKLITKDGTLLRLNKESGELKVEIPEEKNYEKSLIIRQEDLKEYKPGNFRPAGGEERYGA